ncbi:MAG: AMP-binding protein, partial [Verrucomicrobiota bacterium]
MNLMEVLSEQAKQASNRPAIIETKSGQDRVLTFAELEAEVIQAAAIMQAAGLKKGDRVLFLQGVSTELYLALLAVFRLGTVAVFVDPSAGWKKLRQATDLASPSAVVAGFKGQFASWLMPELWSCRQRFAVSSKFCLPGFQRLDRRNHAHREIPIEPCEGDDPALLTFTSGSTGRPKAALRTHDFLLAQHRV